MERPILFSGPMVRAILDGRKTQTRRAIKPWPVDELPDVPVHLCPYGKPGDRLWVRETFCIESCRECGYYPPAFDDGRPIEHHLDDDYGAWWRQPHYRATDPCPELEIGTGDPGVIWHPSIHMPRWASRITLEITDVRVERLHDISEEDAAAEGVKPFVVTQEDVDVAQDCEEEFVAKCAAALGPGAFTHKFEFMFLWDSINEKRGYGWNKNPWVWVISFKRVEAD